MDNIADTNHGRNLRRLYIERLDQNYNVVDDTQQECYGDIHDTKCNVFCLTANGVMASAARIPPLSLIRDFGK